VNIIEQIEEELENIQPVLNIDAGEIVKLNGLTLLPAGYEVLTSEMVEDILNEYV